MERDTALDTNDKKWLKRLLGTHIRFDEMMASHTSFRVGGPADAYASPKTQEQLVELLGWSTQRRVPYFIIGDGTNLLVRDTGIRAIMISLKKCLKGITKAGVEKDMYRVEAFSGGSLSSLCKFAIRNGLSGMNFAIGIPGTIGGGIKMNAGTSYGAMESVLEAIRIVLPNGRTQTLNKHELNFSYRNLALFNKDNDLDDQLPVILNASFILKCGNGQVLKDEANVILADRKKKQPIGWASAGCFFKNPSSEKPAGLLIDRAGLKGKKKGNAMISTQHANFIINTGKASADDILWLMEYAQENVFKQYGIHLEPEVKIVGD